MEREGSEERGLGFIKDFPPGKKRILIAMCIVWFINTIFSIFDIEIVYNIISPGVSVLAIIFMASGVAGTKKYWMSGFYFLIGILFWVISDVLVIIYSYFKVDVTFLEAISDTLYLAPNYAFFIAFFLFAFFKLEKGERFLLIIGVVAFAVVSVIGIVWYLNHDFGIAAYTSEFRVSALAYGLPVAGILSIYVVKLIVRGVFKEDRPTYMLLASLAIYEFFDARYTIYIAMEIEPESAVIDTVYLVSIMLMALAFNDPKLQKEI